MCRSQLIFSKFMHNGESVWLNRISSQVDSCSAFQVRLGKSPANVAAEAINAAPMIQEMVVKKTGLLSLLGGFPDFWDSTP